MPSGITHILLTRNLPRSSDPNDPLNQILAFGGRYLSLGCVAPDLPYSSIFDNDLFRSEKPVADDFHYVTPNQISLLALTKIKRVLGSPKNGDERKRLDAHFCFFVGQATHVIADGIVHPFVLDKVGPYSTNNLAHTALEIGIDVLFWKNLTEGSGEPIETNYSRIEEEFADFGKLPYAAPICEMFSGCIKEVYGREVSVDKIFGWTTGMHRMFSFALGNHPAFLKHPDWTAPFVFRNISDLDAKRDDYLSLTRPKYWDRNFLGGQDTIRFLVDCRNRFNEFAHPYILKAYRYVYEDGPVLTSLDLPEFNLDSGRPTAKKDDLNLKPVLWS